MLEVQEDLGGPLPPAKDVPRSKLDAGSTRRNALRKPGLKRREKEFCKLSCTAEIERQDGYHSIGSQELPRNTKATVSDLDVWHSLSARTVGILSRPFV
ncbi:MAG: hypothetical protein IJU76_06705 [Desulfovibrionaceae bacterium]|nr:hypothetical protein [Desulfovibrionaceae bacterium]